MFLLLISIILSGIFSYIFVILVLWLFFGKYIEYQIDELLCELKFLTHTNIESKFEDLKSPNIFNKSL